MISFHLSLNLDMTIDNITDKKYCFTLFPEVFMDGFICDTIKRNESLVEDFQFEFSTLPSGNLKMLHFDANPNRIGHMVT